MAERLIRFLLVALVGMKIAAYSYEEELYSKRLKVLHLSFHRGCIQEFAGIAKQLSLNVESWFIPDLPPRFFDPESHGNALYNVTHERAERIWQKHKKLFETYDVILVSDTAALSRIFLQHEWKKPLVIWVCNRFDYSDCASLDGNFPDQEYYDLFRKATTSRNVFVIPYTAFESHYAKKKGVDINSFVITPCHPQIDKSPQSVIPNDVNKKEMFFLPPYHNETKFMDLAAHCASLEIPAYCGRYGGPSDLKDFKGIIHLPYNWSNLAFFENLRFGIPYFVPSETFLKQLLATGKYFYADMHFLQKENLFELSEWYSSAHKDVITYFDSWEDLKKKVNSMDFDALRKKVKEHALIHYRQMLDRWDRVFQQIEKIPRIPIEKEADPASPFIVGRLAGQLGNQFFIIAATINLALKHGASPLFPDFTNQNDMGFGLRENYEKIFKVLDVSSPFTSVEYYYKEPEYSFSSIPYHNNMEIRGWFQSEKYFLEHKEEILQLFSPSAEIVRYLRSKYADIINHPQTVAVHVRSYLKEDPQQKVYTHLDMDYYQKAFSFFPDDTLFIIFSTDMQWCKEHFSHLGKKVRFIEGELYYHDLYLMSMCKHNIIANSTFSWWGAYLNKNQKKRVIAPSAWFSPSYYHDTKDLIPKEWIRI